MDITKFELSALARQSLTDVLNAQKGNRFLNPRYEPSTLRALIQGYDRFLGLLSALCDRALNEGNQNLPVKPILKAIELVYDDVSAGAKPECRFARAILKRLDSLEESSAKDTSKVDMLKDVVLALAFGDSELLKYVDWANGWLDTVDTDFLAEALESQSMEVSRYLLCASYSDCSKTRESEYACGRAKEKLLAAMKANLCDAGATDKWKTVISEFSYGRFHSDHALPNTLVEADRELMKKVIRLSDVCTQLQTIADKTPGMWHATFGAYQDILLGVYGYDLEAMKSQLPEGYRKAKETIGIYCNDANLVGNHRTLERVHQLMIDALVNTVSINKNMQHSTACAV